jgi:hypothetical protein
VNEIGFRRGSFPQVQVAPTFCEKQIDHTFWKSLLLGQNTFKQKACASMGPPTTTAAQFLHSTCTHLKMH